jgi:glutathione reductase (NADPH)
MAAIQKNKAKTESYDIVILGGGNAGFGVSAEAAEAGKRIAFVEERDFGGTCPNRGCTPKKVLVAAAHALHEIEIAKIHGIEVGKPSLDWAKLNDREKAMIASIPEKMAELAAKRGDVYRGHARFASPNAVAVGDQILEAEHIVIATGSKPRPLPVPGAEHLITSDEVLSERELPGEVVFIGGGVIAMEFSHVYARAGAKVTILEAMPTVLTGQDAEAVAEVRRESERIGIVIKTDVEVTKIAPAEGRIQISYRHDGKEATVRADRAVNGAGRVANVDTLDLEAGDVRHDKGRIETDGHLRSVSNPAVWVCGDALVTSAQLSPLATYEGQLVGRNIVGGAKEQPDYRTIPSCVYTVPALASVGLTQAQAEKKGLKFEVSVNDMRDWFSGETYGETVAWAKVLTEEGSGRILGAQMVGHSGEELIHLFALAMRQGITAANLKSSVFAFPTFSADVKSLM